MSPVESALTFDYVTYVNNALIIIVLLYCYFMYISLMAATCYAKNYLYHISSQPPILSTSHQMNHDNEEGIKKNQQNQSSSTSLPGVTIIKPLCGLDIHLRENLLTFFHMDYPTYEILFCVSDPHDPVCDVVTSLIQTHSTVDARLLNSPVDVGVNHKVNNMNQGYVAGKYNYLLISDSGICMRPDTLQDMVQCMMHDKRVALVHQLPYIETQFPASHHHRTQHHSDIEDNPLPPSSPGVIQENGTRTPNNSIDENSSSNINESSCLKLGHAVQMIYFGCWHARMYLCAALMGITCTSGMSCLLRKDILQQAGGMKTFAKYLAEDYFIAKYMLDHRWRVVLAHQPAWQNSISSDLSPFHARLARWQQLRLMITPFTTVIEPLTNCLPVVILATLMWSLLLSLHWNTIWIFGIHISIWIMLDYILLRQVHPLNEPIPISLTTFLHAWFYRECVTVAMQMRYLFTTHVKWRGHAYRLHCGGTAEEIPPNNNNNILLQDGMTSIA